MRVALLTNFIAPYRVPVLEALRDRVGELRVFVSTRMEGDRNWVVNWGSLDVVVQRSFALKSRHRDMFGLTRRMEVHFPYDTPARLAEWKPDVVISGELGMRSLLAAAYCMWKPSVPLVIWATLSEHTEQAWGGVRRRLRQVILRRADAVLVNGESGGRYIRRFTRPGTRIVRVNQAVDGALFAAEPRQRPAEACTRVLYSGMLAKHKGVDLFAAQLADWARAHPDRMIEMWWLGDGPLRQQLEALPVPPNLSQRFCGAVQYGELPAFYAQCDALVLPSLRDEWGLVVNEAMAAGLPVLGSIYSQAVEELVHEGETGWQFDPLSASSATDALDRMFGAAPQAVAAMREAAREQVRSLTPFTVAERIAQTLEALVPARRAAGALGAGAKRLPSLPETIDR
jgi:glycosyltransferase involved in cell wall biosynthesis